MNSNYDFVINQERPNNTELRTREALERLNRTNAFGND
jgi:hypothetical protein